MNSNLLLAFVIGSSYLPVFLHWFGLRKFLKNDKTILERKPLEKVSKLGELIAFKHAGFWQCMDHKSDKDILDSMIKKKRAVWL